MTTSKLIPVTVHDRSGVIFAGEVRGISAYNARGLFDVLPVHANFISVLRKKMVLHKMDGSKEEIHLDSGVVRILLNRVEIFVGIK